MDDAEQQDGFAELLRKEFRPASDERKSLIEAALQTLAKQALANKSLIEADVFQSTNSMIHNLKLELEQRPDESGKIQQAIDQLTDLLAYTEGKDFAQELLGKILSDQSLLEEVSGYDAALAEEERRYPKTAEQYELRQIRSEGQFFRHKLSDLLDSQPETGRSIVTYIVHRALTEHADQAGAFLEQEFSRRISRYDDRELQSEILDGSLGRLADGDRHFIQLSFDGLHAAWQNERRFILFLKDRLDESTDSSHPPSIVERTERLAAYAKAHGEEGLQEYARLLFPEWSLPKSVETAAATPAVSLPTEAPEKYNGLRGPETPPAFVQRVYGEWLGQGLTRAHIRQLDPTLYQAIVNWTRKPENEWPADVDLPTLKEQNTRWIDRVDRDGIMSAVDGLSGQEAVREARRLANLRHRRSKEQQQK